EILGHIRRFEQSRCYLPTIAELAQAAGVSRTTAFEHIARLQEKGLLRKSTGRARSLRLTARASRLLEYAGQLEQDETGGGGEGLRLCGRVAAGAPIEAIENVEEISLRSVFGEGDDVFALEVRGDSMIDEGIDTGDFIVCKKATGAEYGQMVVAIVDDENATVKRFYRDKGQVRLESSNAAYEPIYTENCRIEAVVLGVVRRLHP
ncbi:MAG: repressor LexA, partial [Planctomycetota bacterium]